MASLFGLVRPGMNILPAGKLSTIIPVWIDDRIRHSFILREVVEARPSEEALRIPGMQDEIRRPMMLLISAEKK